MMKLTLAAAAFAAGMMTFGVHAKEAPKDAAKTATCPYLFGCDSKVKAADKKTGKKAVANAQKKTSSVSQKPKPALKAKARKTVTSKSAKAAAKPASNAAKVRKNGKSKAVVSKARRGAKVATKGSRGAGKQYSEIVSRYASSYGVPASLAHAVIKVESSYRADARGAAGEIGLMQIKPATARMLGYSGSVSGLFNPETNIKFGVKYLAQAHKLSGGTTCGTILKYNAGHGAKRMNPISAAYCSKVKQQLNR
ncbi:transglycosylase SLT domain-containing protein [Mesorhizobium sp. NBSH29]|uniref:lytic transglycosylase domain-containing protein n=1 Tax=Mesorhizobium sp. NBSH29 TaxID=2654249 RepID=UPI0018964B99|nr:lytic transglycosylase domain-containing protein [Mesorhizobium sp. NBSH29]QPC88214.1 transglycosylase SLT domain-containing protein [Mesorhizobium sp. NBSH29]